MVLLDLILGAVTARDWSCGLIDHIIYLMMLHVRFFSEMHYCEMTAHFNTEG